MMKIPLSHGYSAIVDDEDFDLLRPFVWSADFRKGRVGVRGYDYSEGWRNRRRVSMTRLILNTLPATKTTFLDGDALNHTRANLLPGINLYESYVVNPATGCWEWMRALEHNGYGRVIFQGKRWGAHRLSYVLHNRCEIPSGLVVMHSCDNPICVNPAHLSLGTDADNAADCRAKGRMAGQLNLSAEIVAGIRADARVQDAIAVEYGISQSMVSKIKSGAWGDAGK